MILRSSLWSEKETLPSQHSIGFVSVAQLYLLCWSANCGLLLDLRCRHSLLLVGFIPSFCSRAVNFFPCRSSFREESHHNSFAALEAPYFVPNSTTGQENTHPLFRIPRCPNFKNKNSNINFETVTLYSFCIYIIAYFYLVRPCPIVVITYCKI